jgi:hypothetical protein
MSNKLFNKNMKAFLITAVAFLLSAYSFFGCVFPEVNTPPPVEFAVPDGYSVIETGEQTAAAVSGIGVEFDPHYFSQNVTRNVPGLTEQAWSDVIAKRVKAMQILFQSFHNSSP